MVAQGKFKIACFEDGDLLRAVSDGHTVAHRRADGSWSKPAKKTPLPKPGKYDHVKANGPAVVIQLTKGDYY